MYEARKVTVFHSVPLSPMSLALSSLVASSLAHIAGSLITNAFGMTRRPGTLVSASDATPLAPPHASLCLNDLHRSL